MERIRVDGAIALVLICRFAQIYGNSNGSTRLGSHHSSKPMTFPASTSPALLPEIPGYTILEQLYLGSRTAVYRAVQTAQNRSVVMKVLRREYPSFGELVQFRNQYTIAKNLPISGIVQPLSLESLGSGYALVMEDWGGVSLEKYVQEQSLDLVEVLAIALQVADILHDLCQHRVVHKDIKPANILIHPESKQVKLIDFSIASLLPKETQEIQSPNILEGTLAYLAPEQTGRMNRGIDYRADFYALGVTLYQLLTGILPFASDDPLELMHCHIAKLPVPTNQVNPGVPVMVATIITKLMAKNAEDRYQSAIGLKHDLERCLTQWQETGGIVEFELGQRDLSDRFLIPEKLYGREAEVQSLLEAFDRVAGGASELMLVAGFSGIGKTAVVNEVHKPIVRQRGYFIKGKFDQFNRNIPLSAFVQALRDLMGQLLSEADAQLSQWRAQILASVGDNGQVLIDVIPELEQIIGKQPIASELSGGAAQNRFNLLFQKFVEVFTTAEHPLVLFLDDLQWADLASLQLIKLLMNDNGYLLMLGAYRDNEVSPAHPFSLMVAELKQTQAIVHTLTLAPMTFDATNHLVADTLHCSRALAKSLTEFIGHKTKGNPFFTTQFLKALHEDGHIHLDRDRCYWECDIAQVNALAITDDVVEFMTLQLQKLPLETQQVLKLAACVGNQFDLATLAIVSEQSLMNAATALWKALQEGLILPTSQVYKFFQNAEPSDTQSSVNPAYRFLHDRVQQAAYSLIPEDKRQATHLLIGRLLLQNTPASRLEDNIFEIVNHWSGAIDLIVDSLERQKLAILNLTAGQKAKASTAYESALSYLNIGIKLLPEDSWQTQYDLTLSLYTIGAESALLCGDYQRMESLIETVLNHAREILDTIKVYKVKIQARIVQNQQQDCLDTGLSVLRQLGVPLETKLPNQVESIQELIHLPAMDDPYKLAAADILIDVITPAWTLNPEIFQQTIFTLVNLSFNFGHCPAAAFGYAWYGAFLCETLGDVDSGYQFGQLAVKLLDKFDAKGLRSSVNDLFATHIGHWKDHTRTTLPFHLEGLRYGLETGNLEYVGYSAAEYCQYLFLVGESLDVVEEKCRYYLALIQKLQLKFHFLYLAPWQQGVLNLRGDLTDQATQLVGECYDEREHLQRIVDNNQLTLGFVNFFVKSLLCFLFADYDKAIEYSQIALRNRSGVFGTYFIPTTFFYASLSLLANYFNVEIVQQQQYCQQVIENLSILKKYAADAPINHLHKHDLVEAEYRRVLGQNYEAMDYYDRAIAGATNNGYIQEAAIANELAAKFYLNLGKEKIAASYMQDAYYCYAHWGAKAKVQDLEYCYPKLLTPILQQPLIAISTSETLFIPHLATFQATDAQSSSSGSPSISATLDLATILKASQTLSSEIQLDKLLATLLHIVLENAGADKGALLMPREQQWFVEAIAILDQPARVESVALSSSPEVPHALINTVKRSQQPVVIVDASAHPLLATDDYVVQQQPKSILCIPLLQQGKLVAILYLENQVTIGAFTSDRVELLNFLCTQAAISLENARLYQQAQTYAQQLEKSQLQIVQSEKMASLGNLVAGIAHEINNPLSFLNGSVNNAKNYFQDLLRHLALYQQHYPNAVAPVQDHEKDIDLEFLSEDLPKLLKSMAGATDRIKGISTSLRTFSRADTDYKVTANLHEGLDSTLLILKYRIKANEHRPAIEVIQDYGELPEIECFPGQLNQVFMNILANAIDMFDEMSQGQTFSRLESNPQQITIRTMVVANQVQIQIRDNGKGITEEVKKRIFDHLFTTKGVGKGTGLGLAIASQIVVEKHGGRLKVQSEVGQGTEFLILLPIQC